MAAERAGYVDPNSCSLSRHARIGSTIPIISLLRVLAQPRSVSKGREHGLISITMLGKGENNQRVKALRFWQPQRLIFQF
jgi:hypothetical protein